MAERAEKQRDSGVEDQPPEQREMTRDEWWDLLESMKGSWTGQFAQYGGAEAFVRKLRSDAENPFG